MFFFMEAEMETKTETRTNMNDLIAARNVLTSNLADCEPGCFPGSKGWRAEKIAMDALDAFDAANPEVRRAHVASLREGSAGEASLEGVQS
jgi:hypothetical protein